MRIELVLTDVQIQELIRILKASNANDLLEELRLAVSKEFLNCFGF